MRLRSWQNVLIDRLLLFKLKLISSIVFLINDSYINKSFQTGLSKFPQRYRWKTTAAHYDRVLLAAFSAILFRLSTTLINITAFRNTRIVMEVLS